MQGWSDWFAGNSVQGSLYILGFDPRKLIVN